APEAGTHRLRDVINKGITEEELILHAQKLLEHGFRQVKLYFMLGLPTETDEDLEGIVELCQKVRQAAGPNNPKLQVTCALSPFVPKPFTPFQWAPQIPLEEITRRIYLVKDLIKNKKGLTLRWHEPSVSYLEGIMSRAGREMAEVVEKAYAKGAIFCSWLEHFKLEPWLEALAEQKIDPNLAIGPRDYCDKLPWDHLEAGIAKDFLWHEWLKAQKGETTADCRYASCQGCGACDRKNTPSRLRTPKTPSEISYQNRLVFAKRDQKAHEAHFDELGRLRVETIAKAPKINPELTKKVVQYRLWHSKTQGLALVSQLELQSILERALRRAKIPLAFSAGFHPMPLLSFGRALPVGVESQAEWFAITLNSYLDAETIFHRLNPYLPSGLHILRLESVDKASRSALSVAELFSLSFPKADFRQVSQAWQNFYAKEHFPYLLTTKKGVKSLDLRPLVSAYELNEQDQKLPQGESIKLNFTTNWATDYLSPLKLISGILELKDLDLVKYKLLKYGQIFAEQSRNFCQESEQ
ncbi:MAG: DUF2344 domain-containing protein, partial [Desulfovibrio sp.]|nr:DUF2344 domain-containing protein [Desulfovibrio sp.]